MSSQDSSTEQAAKSMSDELAGRRILLIEDSPVVAPFTVDVLEDLGCEVVGPAPTMAAARKLIEEGAFDAALIDIHIRGERAFPLCDMLAAKGVPFAFTSGYADWQIPEKWEDRPRLNKPYTADQVEAALRSLFG
jgi:CheY-like chemotaxis protein